MILNPWRTLPFIAQLHLQPPKIRFVLPLKTPRSNLIVFHMREEKFFIIRPTKADNLHKRKLRSHLGLHRNTCLHLQLNQKFDKHLKMESAVRKSDSRDQSRGLGRAPGRACCLLWEAATWARGPGRACHFWPRPGPAAQVARVVLFSSDSAISIHVLMAFWTQ